jgi:hypothetical protein
MGESGMSKGLFSAPKDNSAEIMRQQEAARQARIMQGRETIGKNFGQFDDSFFGGLADAYKEFYNPQLQTNYERARRDLALRMPTTGSAYTQKIAEMEKDFLAEQARISGAAESTAAQRRADISQSRSALEQQLEAGAGVDTIGSSAAAQASQAALPMQFSPLADIFQKYAGNVAMATQAENMGYNPMRPLSFGSSGSSVRTIR